MTTKPLSINSLLLDLENPRIVRAGSQRDALQRIIDDQDVRLAVLAENIVRHGLNPMDRWLVLRQGETSKFITYEGNRRLAALKIMSNPAVLGSLEIKPALKKRFERAANSFDLKSFGKIDCYVIGNRAEGAMWIHQRHTGANRGSGIVDWSGLATARFRGSDPALQALDAVMKFASLPIDARDEIEAGFPITTLDRLLSSVPVRSMIGFDVKQSKLLTDLPPDTALRLLTRIVRELASGKISVSDVKVKSQQISYIKELGADLPDLSTRTGQLVAVEDWSDDTFHIASLHPTSAKPKGAEHNTKPSQPTQKSTPSQPQRPHVRKVLIERDCRLSVQNSKIREIEAELRSLQLATHRHAIAVLFRVFLETSVDWYLTSNGIPLTVVHNGRTIDKKLSTKVMDAINQLVAEGIPQKHLDGVSKGIHDKHSAIHIDTLHAYVHNQFYSPKESDLSVAFDNARPFIEAIWK